MSTKKISIWWNNTHVNAIKIYCDICSIIKNVKKRKKDIRYRKDFFFLIPLKKTLKLFPKKNIPGEYSVNDNSNDDHGTDDDDDDENEAYSDNVDDEDSLHLVHICYAIKTWFAYIIEPHNTVMRQKYNFYTVENHKVTQVAWGKAGTWLSFVLIQNPKPLATITMLFS